MAQSRDRGSVAEGLELRAVGLPSSETAYRPYIVSSLALATLVGFVLSVHIPLARLLGVGRPERTADLIQAHGQAQLLGFAGLFVMGMSFRLMPRFAGTRIAFPKLIPLVLYLMAFGLLLRALLMPWLYGDAHDAAFLGSDFALLLGSACFVLITITTVAIAPRRHDPPSLPFVLGAGLLFIGLEISTVSAVEAVKDGSRSLPYLANTAVLQLELPGFLLSFILGVSSRALPTMFGVSRSDRLTKLTAVLLAAAVLVLAACLLYVEYVSNDYLVVRLASSAFSTLGIAFLLMAWIAGVLRPSANRIRPASRPHLWLLRSAFIWLGFAGLISIYYGSAALLAGHLPSPLEFDAVRHALGLGVVTNLVLGMSLMILPEFAGQRQAPNHQRMLALSVAALINVAAVLRVLPSIAGTRWSWDLRNLFVATGGTLAELAMLAFAFALIRLIMRKRPPVPGQ